LNFWFPKDTQLPVPDASGDSAYFLTAGELTVAGGDTKSCRAFFQSCVIPQAQGSPTNSQAKSTKTAGVFFTFSIAAPLQDR
jgi:hypothetical protein